MMPFFRDRDVVELGVPVLQEGLGHVLVGHLLELDQRAAGVGLELPGAGHILFARHVVEDVRPRVFAREAAAGERGLDRPIAAGALLVRHVHVQAIGLRLAGQVRAVVLVVLPGQRMLVVLIQARRGVGIGHCIQFAAADPVGRCGAGGELEQALGAVRAAAGLLVEPAAGFDLGETHEIVDRNVAFLGLSLDDVEVLGLRIIACHLVLLLEVDIQRPAPPRSTELVRELVSARSTNLVGTTGIAGGAVVLLPYPPFFGRYCPLAWSYA
ncbi:hypothetical protein [Xanthomonas translucens]|uniref:hypothetical protein n=1 Tax=Xanthomonas campestris pv. translucens TaxID=343 RepID=UPI00210A6F03|nr:hypothetical protein [Xanthomonas translucens]